MADGRHLPVALVRPEFEVQPGEAAQIGDVARPLATWERINNSPFAWRVVILVILAAVWELYARWLNNPLMFPAFSEMAAALWDAMVRGPLIARTLTTIRVLLMG
jgi:NitT/TauT family transport system permease protein